MRSDGSDFAFHHLRRGGETETLDLVPPQGAVLLVGKMRLPAKDGPFDPQQRAVIGHRVLCERRQALLRRYVLDRAISLLRQRRAS